MNKILLLTIISLLPILAVVILTSLSSESEIGLVNMEELSKKIQEKYDYVEQNANYAPTERQYSSAMYLANHDPKKAVEILNDPDYPEKYFNENGTVSLP